ncbi:MAG: anti-sigma F factor antagonist [Bacillota bacterium]
METESLLHGDCLIVRVRGELDHHQADQFRQTVDQGLDDQRVNRLVLNLEGLSFMDSSGIGLILGRFKRVQQKQGQMAICGVTEAVSKVLEISGVPRVIPFMRNEKEALQKTARGINPKRRMR